MEAYSQFKQRIKEELENSQEQLLANLYLNLKAASGITYGNKEVSWNEVLKDQYNLYLEIGKQLGISEDRVREITEYILENETKL